MFNVEEYKVEVESFEVDYLLKVFGIVEGRLALLSAAGTVNTDEDVWGEINMLVGKRDVLREVIVSRAGSAGRGDDVDDKKQV